MSSLSFNPITSTPVQCIQGEWIIPFIFAISLSRVWRLLQCPFPSTIAIPHYLFFLGHDFQTPLLLFSSRLSLIGERFCQQSPRDYRYPKDEPLWDLMEINVRNIHNWMQLYATSDGRSKAGGTTYKATFCMLQNFPSWQAPLQHRQLPTLARSKRRQKMQICNSKYFKFVRNNCFRGEK